ncbi:hypothetical protein RHSIM_RhsimUnG0140700 [Rhododendron simsii]|uniref:Uncharacterized protein n=1 Tax=Rhododendron simsii TaxID=118357 RepID=A0A834G0M3_RHOSS|nr:hypothetical protein RHSIM_RhsimUnG0140700 [Rhododendron simsii]
MHNVDLRLVVPALINLTLFLLQHHHYQAAGKYPTFNMNPNSWFFAIVVLMLFLTTSVKLPLSVTTERIRVRAGDFSFFVAISLLGLYVCRNPFSGSGTLSSFVSLLGTVFFRDYWWDFFSGFADDDDIGSGNPIFLDQPTSEPNTVLVVEP